MQAAQQLDPALTALVADQGRLVLAPGVEHVARTRLDDGAETVGIEAAPGVGDLAGQVRAFVEAGVDALFTDNVDVVVAALREG